jgi:hypothetical protein
MIRSGFDLIKIVYVMLEVNSDMLDVIDDIVEVTHNMIRVMYVIVQVKRVTIQVKHDMRDVTDDAAARGRRIPDREDYWTLSAVSSMTNDVCSELSSEPRK